MASRKSQKLPTMLREVTAKIFFRGPNSRISSSTAARVVIDIRRAIVPWQKLKPWYGFSGRVEEAAYVERAGRTWWTPFRPPTG